MCFNMFKVVKIVQINCFHQRNNYNISFSLENSLNVKCLKIEWRWIGQFADYELEWKHLSYTRNMATNIFCYKNILDGFRVFLWKLSATEAKSRSFVDSRASSNNTGSAKLTRLFHAKPASFRSCSKTAFPRAPKESTQLSSELLTFTWIKLRRENKTEPWQATPVNRPLEAVMRPTMSL